jgi:hypothetical protein
MAHRNSNENEEPHHLYEIVDKKDYDTFKYGISSGPISEKDGMSKKNARAVADSKFDCRLGAVLCEDTDIQHPRP